MPLLRSMYNQKYWLSQQICHFFLIFMEFIAQLLTLLTLLSSITFAFIIIYLIVYYLGLSQELISNQYFQIHSFIILFSETSKFMKNDSQIFTKRLNNLKILGSIRFANTSISLKKQQSIYEKPFRLSKNNFKQKTFTSDKQIMSAPPKVDKNNELSPSPSARNKSSRGTRYRLCNSKKVCVLSNISKVQIPDSHHNNLNQNGYFRVVQTQYQKQRKQLMIYQSLSSKLKKIKNLQFSQGIGFNFKLGSMSSSLSCRQGDKRKDRSVDPWHNEDDAEDPDIIFYK